ncbi:hypothetical protein ASD60_26740 [Pseudomonas sp. Root562]|nr:hypothetical protein ASD60_26740 [Pseudomonas sp. Root562]
MNRSTLTAVTVVGLLSLGSVSVYAGNDAPVDKGGMPPSTEMNAGAGPENALPPGSIGGDADGGSTSSEGGAGKNTRGESIGRESEARKAGNSENVNAEMEE